MPKHQVFINRVIVRSATHGDFYIQNGSATLVAGLVFTSYYDKDGREHPTYLRISKIKYWEDKTEFPPHKLGNIEVQGDCNDIHKHYSLVLDEI